ncbi:hypothetical protein HDU76_006126, partial [Blyttiomyces sp. JEL0837]
MVAAAVSASASVSTSASTSLAAANVTKAPILLVLDLNGTMVDRVKKTERTIAKKNPTFPSRPDFTMEDNS